MFRGKWKIVEMEQWDPDYIDLEGPGYIQFKADDLGEFQFGAVQAGLDYRIVALANPPRVEFSWDGFSEMDPVAGRGWAEVRDAELHGHLYFHLGDDSSFRAEKVR